MSVEYKVLGQSAPLAAVLTDVYTVPAETSAIISTISVCSREASTPIRIAIRPSGGALDNKHYIVHDVTLAAYEALFLTVGVTLAAGDVISVYNEYENASFNIFGSEVT